METLRAEIERLKQEKKKPLQERIAVRMLEIDPTTGHLFYSAPRASRCRSEADAHELVLRDREAIGETGRELYYEILYPRDPDSAYPLLKQKEQYDEWFKDVAHGWDVPGEPLKGVKR